MLIVTVYHILLFLSTLSPQKSKRPYLTFYPPLDIYSNNIVTISLNQSHFPLSLWKDDNLSISLNEERKACPLTTDSSFVHHQYKSGLICK